MLDQATAQLRPGKNRRSRVAGLIATPAQPIPEDMQAALTERQALIEARARRLVEDAQEAGAAWVSRLGTPRPQARAREQWLSHAATVALYRHRYDIDSPAPLGDAKEIRTAEQAAEHRAARAALSQLQRLAEASADVRHRRNSPRADQGHHL